MGAMTTIRSRLARTLVLAVLSILTLGVFAPSVASAHSRHDGAPTPPVASPMETNFWLATPTGEVLAFGSAQSYGSVKGPLNRPIVGMEPTPDQKGYWLVASDGGIFSLGDAKFHGSTGA